MKTEREIFYRPLSETFRNKVVTFDMDGVLSLTVYPVVEKFNRDFGTDYDVHEFYGWHTVKNWAKENWDDRDPSVDEIAKDPEEYDTWIWTDSRILYSGVLGPHADLITRCATETALYAGVVTSRKPSLRESTLRWYKDRLPWFGPDSIGINTDENIPGEVFKYEELARLARQGPLLHFEDSLRHARLIVENTPATVVLLANWDVSKSDGYHHRRIIQVQRLNHRLTTMRDVHKKLIFEPGFIPSHNVDKGNTL